jgi:hypothetical protein
MLDVPPSRTTHHESLNSQLFTTTHGSRGHSTHRDDLDLRFGSGTEERKSRLSGSSKSCERLGRAPFQWLRRRQSDRAVPTMAKVITDGSGTMTTRKPTLEYSTCGALLAS